MDKPNKTPYLRFGEAELPIMGPALEIIGSYDSERNTAGARPAAAQLVPADAGNDTPPPARNGLFSFPSVSEGYLRHIEELQYEITAYLREHPSESALSVRLSGPSMKSGIIRVSLVGDLVSGFQ
jgi:hypothetical protein